MTRFELVKKVLDSLWDTVEGETDEDKIKAVKKAQDSLTQKYSNIREISGIDYSDPATQVAYIYTYTASHADILYQVLDKANLKNEFREKGPIKLTSFGGGPGSDMLGFMKFLEKNDFEQVDFIHNSCDKDDDWSFCWPNVIEQCGNDCKTFTKISASFHKVDVTEPQKKKE